MLITPRFLLSIHYYHFIPPFDSPFYIHSVSFYPSLIKSQKILTAPITRKLMNEEQPTKDKSGLRSYQFERVRKNKTITHYDPRFGKWTEEFRGMFYTKKCIFCSVEFEARRVDTAFCSQGCQKAHLRLRKKNLE